MIDAIPRYTLPHDVSRCSGDACRVRETCLRYLAGTAEIATDSMPARAVWISGMYAKGGCPLFMPADDSAGDAHG